MITETIILDAVCRAGNISCEELKSKSRKRELVIYRHIAISLLRKIGYSTVKTAKIFNRDHSSVIYAESNIRNNAPFYAELSKAIVSVNTILQTKMPMVYISGKITGVENLNAERFERAEHLMLSKGYRPINPLKLPHVMGHATRKWSDYMREDIKAMMDCSAVAVLGDWIDSKGAMLEVNIAREIGIELWFLSNDESEILTVVK